MNYGLYTSFLGMRARMRTLEAIANNVANATTTGFKAEQMYFRSVESSRFDQELAFSQGSPANNTQPTPTGAPPIGNANNGNSTSEADQPLRALGVTSGSRFDFSQGSIRLTGRSLDVALEGDGLLVVQTPRGERYTRDGALTIDATGQLVTSQGHLVVGEGGPITVRPGEIAIGNDGRMTANGQEIGRLKIVRFENPPANLLKEGDSLFVTINNAQPQAAPQTRVQQGMLETSNVSPVTEMAAMMQANREFESLQRSITLMMNVKKAASEIGKI